MSMPISSKRPLSPSVMKSQYSPRSVSMPAREKIPLMTGLSDETGLSIINKLQQQTGQAISPHQMQQIMIVVAIVRAYYQKEANDNESTKPQEANKTQALTLDEKVARIALIFQEARKQAPSLMSNNYNDYVPRVTNRQRAKQAYQKPQALNDNDGGDGGLTWNDVAQGLGQGLGGLGNGIVIGGQGLWDGTKWCWNKINLAKREHNDNGNGIANPRGDNQLRRRNEFGGGNADTDSDGLSPARPETQLGVRRGLTVRTSGDDVLDPNTYGADPQQFPGTNVTIERPLLAEPTGIQGWVGSLRRGIGTLRSMRRGNSIRRQRQEQRRIQLMDGIDEVDENPTPPARPLETIVGRFEMGT